jgi:hypothetical protein
MEQSQADNTQMFHIRAAINRQNHTLVRRRIRTSRGHKPHRLGILLAWGDLLSRLHDLGVAHLRAVAKATSCEVPGSISECKSLLSLAAID